MWVLRNQEDYISLRERCPEDVRAVEEAVAALPSNVFHKGVKWAQRMFGLRVKVNLMLLR